MSIDLLLWIAALIFMLLDTFAVPARVKWFSLSLACIIATFII